MNGYPGGRYLPPNPLNGNPRGSLIKQLAGSVGSRFNPGPSNPFLGGPHGAGGYQAPSPFAPTPAPAPPADIGQLFQTPQAGLTGPAPDAIAHVGPPQGLLHRIQPIIDRLNAHTQEHQGVDLHPAIKQALVLHHAMSRGPIGPEPGAINTPMGAGHQLPLHQANIGGNAIAQALAALAQRSLGRNNRYNR